MKRRSPLQIANAYNNTRLLRTYKYLYRTVILDEDNKLAVRAGQVPRSNKNVPPAFTLTLSLRSADRPRRLDRPAPRTPTYASNKSGPNVSIGTIRNLSAHGPPSPNSRAHARLSPPSQAYSSTLHPFFSAVRTHPRNPSSLNCPTFPSPVARTIVDPFGGASASTSAIAWCSLSCRS